MKILILHLFLGSILLMGAIQPPGRDQLSKRLMALKFRHTFRNRKAHQ